jgi:hypothetical protein
MAALVLGVAPPPKPYNSKLPYWKNKEHHMSRILTIAGAVALAAATAHAQLDVRHYYITNDVSQARSAVAPLRWYQGESLKIDLYAVRGTAPVSLSTVTSVWKKTEYSQ